MNQIKTNPTSPKMTADEFLDQTPQFNPRDVVYKSLKDFGASKVATAALMGDIQQESDFNPSHSGDRGKSFGLFQVGKPMFDQFHQDTLRKGVSPSSRDYVYEQPKFVLSRFKAQHPDRWNAMQNAPDAPTALKIFRSTPDWGYGIAGNRYTFASQYEKKLPADRAEKFLGEVRKSDQAESFLGAPPNLPKEEQTLYRQLEKNRMEAAEQGVFPKAIPLSGEERWQAHLESQNKLRASQGLPPLELLEPGKTPEGVTARPPNIYESAMNKVKEWWDWLNPPQAPIEAYTGGKKPGSLLGAETDPFQVSEQQPLIQRSLETWGNLMNSTIRGLTSAEAVMSYPIFSIPGVAEGYAAYTLAQVPSQAEEVRREFQTKGPTPAVIQKTLEIGGNDFLAAMFPIMAHRARAKIGGDRYAEQRSDAQIQARETAQREQAGAKGEKAQPSDSDNVKREAERVATGGLPPQTPEVRGEQAGGIETRVSQTAIRMPSGEIFEAPTHGQAIEKAEAVHPNYPFSLTESGFTDTNGKFLTRKQAENLAKKTGQELHRPLPRLRSKEKSTGELFQGADQPFNLAGEAGIDFEARKAAAEAEAAAAEKARAEAEKAQMTFEEEPSKAERLPVGQIFMAPTPEGDFVQYRHEGNNVVTDLSTGKKYQLTSEQLKAMGATERIVEPSKAEMLRMQRESEEAILADAEQHMARGGTDIVSFVQQHGGFPSEESPHYAPLKGELDALREEWRKSGKGRGAKFVKQGGVRYGDIFKKDAGSLDRLFQNAQEAGFDVERREDVIDLFREQVRTGKKIYGSEARGQALATEEAYGFNARDRYSMGVRFDNNIANSIINNVISAIQAIRKGFKRFPPRAVESPKLNLDDGGATPPPPNSVFSPDTPPDSDPVPVYATRIDSAFKRWWERWWPRDLAVQKLDRSLRAKGGEPSPVITEHQRIIKSHSDYMNNFANSPWWRAVRGRSQEEIIDVEDNAVKLYRARLQQELTRRGIQPETVELGLGDVRFLDPAKRTPHRLQQELAIQGSRQAARKWVVDQMPQWFRDIVNYRESRIPIEFKAAEELGVTPPRYTGDPYIARLTNEEGKDVVDLNPSQMNIGKQISESIGAFDNSRTHATMKDGIKEATQYEPTSKAIWLRELNSIRLESTANFLREMKAKGVLWDSKQAAYNASPRKRISAVRGLGGRNYWARSPEEAVFIEQNLSSHPRSPLGKLQQLSNTYVRNPSLWNPLPHVTKNMFFKYALARVNNATFRADAAEYARATPTELRKRFDRVMPFPLSSERLPQLTAREVGNWSERMSTRGMKTNAISQQIIFNKADPAMRFSLWKDYVKKGMTDQEAANHVWIDLIRYDANSGGMNFWKAIPFNFFVPWRTGTYVTLAKALSSHPIRTLAFVGAIEYLREIRYRATGKWTHLPVDYLDAPLAEAVEESGKVKDVRSFGKAAEHTGAIAATTLVFGPGGGQAPSTIKDVMDALRGDPQNRARIMNMFWGISQMFNLPREWNSFRKDGDPQHLVNLLTTAALSEHSALKYEPRRLMKWLPEWMPGLQKAELVKQAEALQQMVQQKAEKGQETYQMRHGVSRTFEMTPESQQLEELRRAAGKRDTKGRKSRDTTFVR